MLNMNKKLRASLSVCGAFLYIGQAMAQSTPLDTPVALQSMSDEVQKIFAEQLKKQGQTDEGVHRSIAQDMKKYIGLINLKDIETQNILRLMAPPAFDHTITLSSRMLEAQNTLVPFQEALVYDVANYDMNTPADETGEAYFFSQRLPIDSPNYDALLAGLLNPASGEIDDLLASTLLSGHAYESDAKAANAFDFIKNTTNFYPIAMLPDSEMYSENGKLTEKGNRHLMAIYKQLPSMSMAQNSLLAIHAQKQRFPGLGDGLSVGKDGSASLMEVMAYEVERRMSPDWYNAMNQMSAEGLLKEIAYILAFQSFLNFKGYEQGLRIEAMTAAQMGGFSGMLNVPAPPTTEELMQNF